MHRFIANDPGHAVRTDEHDLAQQDAVVNRANFFKAQETIRFSLDDEQADFVHMGIQHNAERPLGTAAPRVLDGNEIPQRVDLVFVNQRFDLGENKVANDPFIARDPACIRQLF